MGANVQKYNETIDKFLESEDLEIPHRDTLVMILKELDETLYEDRSLFDSTMKHRKKRLIESLITKGFDNLPFDYSAVLIAEKMKELGYVVKMELSRIHISVF